MVRSQTPRTKKASDKESSDTRQPTERGRGGSSTDRDSDFALARPVPKRSIFSGGLSIGKSRVFAPICVFAG
jgi:hypothetical protein